MILPSDSFRGVNWLEGFCPITITALINYYFLTPRNPYTLTASDTPSNYLIELRMLSFVTAKEDLGSNRPILSMK